MVNGYLSYEGAFNTGDKSYLRSDYIDISTYSEVTLKSSNNNIRFYSVYFYDSNKKYVDMGDIYGTGDKTFSTEGNYYMAFDMESIGFVNINPSDVEITMIGS